MLAFLLSPLGRTVAAAAVAVLLLGGVYVKGRHDGADAIRAAVAAKAVRAGADLRAAEREAATLPDDKLFDSLRTGK